MHDKNLKDSKFNEWQDLVKETVKRFPERKRSFTTSSDIDVECLYYTEEKDYHEKLGFPGMYPYTRGFNRQCIEVDYGRCDNMPVSVQLKKRMSVFDIC